MHSTHLCVIAAKCVKIMKYVMKRFGSLWWKPCTSLVRRKFRKMIPSSPSPINRIILVHPHFYLFMLLMVSYTILITVFHLYDIRLVIQAVPGKF